VVAAALCRRWQGEHAPRQAWCWHGQPDVARQFQPGVIEQEVVHEDVMHKARVAVAIALFTLLLGTPNGMLDQSLR
jgi:hypothetical protein